MASMRAFSINRQLTRVNPALLDSFAPRANNQPMVEKTQNTFADRFEQLRAGMAYQALSEAIFRKTGRKISAQALHKWGKGGGVEIENVKAAAEFFGVDEAWLMYGTGDRDAASLQRIVDALPADERQQVLDFVEYKFAKTDGLLASDIAGDYMKMIDKIREDMKRRLDKPEEDK